MGIWTWEFDIVISALSFVSLSWAKTTVIIFAASQGLKVP